jgi:hypothetical protein
MAIRYIHLSDQSTNGSLPIPKDYIPLVRQQFKNWLISVGVFTADRAEKQGNAMKRILLHLTGILSLILIWRIVSGISIH